VVVPAGGRERLREVELWLIRLIVVHSTAVGILLLFAPTWSANFGGWGSVEPLFFMRQAGVFHIIVAVGYLLEYRQRGGVSFLVFTKSVAFVFLVSVTLFGETAWAVPLSAGGDGLMALVVALVHREATGSVTAGSLP
jgi:hypothetical protein